MNIRDLEGSIVALVTPFDEDGKVDFDALGDLVDFHLANGTDAILTLGTTGESSTMTDEEDDADMTLADDRGRGRYSAPRGYKAARDLYEEEDGYEEEYEEYDDEEMDPRDVIAEKIIRWAPPITAVLCAIVALIGFLLA